MTKPILLLQFRPPPTAEHEVKCLKRAMGLKRGELEVVNVTQGDLLPKLKDLGKYKALILGASSDYYISSWSRDTRDKCLKAKPIVEYFVRHDKPTLGICFGHQLLALFLGGKVSRDDKQAEGGVVDIYLKNNSHILFEGLPKKFAIASGHKDSVTKLPKGAKLLASSKATKNSVLQIKNNIFGIQQHPELDLDGLLWRLSLFPEYMRGRSIEEVRKEFRPMPYAARVLANFKKLLK